MKPRQCLKHRLRSKIPEQYVPTADWTVGPALLLWPRPNDERAVVEEIFDHDLIIILS